MPWGRVPCCPWEGAGIEQRLPAVGSGAARPAWAFLTHRVAGVSVPCKVSVLPISGAVREPNVLGKGRPMGWVVCSAFSPLSRVPPSLYPLPRSCWRLWQHQKLLHPLDAAGASSLCVPRGAFLFSSSQKGAVTSAQHPQGCSCAVQRGKLRHSLCPKPVTAWGWARRAPGLGELI